MDYLHILFPSFSTPEMNVPNQPRPHTIPDKEYVDEHGIRAPIKPKMQQLVAASPPGRFHHARTPKGGFQLNSKKHVRSSAGAGAGAGAGAVGGHFTAGCVLI